MGWLLDGSSYVRLWHRSGELDPQHPSNAVIVNIDKAPQYPGCVEYETDVYIMRPQT